MSTALQVRSFKISLFSKPHSWYGSGLLLIWLFPGFSCREIAFKLSTSYSLWPTKAYEVCIRKRSWIVTSVIHYHIIALRTRHCELGIAADFFLCRGGRIEFLLFFFFFFFFSTLFCRFKFCFQNVIFYWLIIHILFLHVLESKYIALSIITEIRFFWTDIFCTKNKWDATN